MNAPERPAINGKIKSTIRLIRFSSNEIGQIAYSLPVHVDIAICKVTTPSEFYVGSHKRFPSRTLISEPWQKKTESGTTSVKNE